MQGPSLASKTGSLTVQLRRRETRQLHGVLITEQALGCCRVCRSGVEVTFSRRGVWCR